MRVQVELIGQLRKVAGCGETVVNIENGNSILDLINALAKSHGEIFEERIFEIGRANVIAEDLSILPNGKIFTRDKNSIHKAKRERHGGLDSRVNRMKAIF